MTKLGPSRYAVLRDHARAPEGRWVTDTGRDLGLDVIELLFLVGHCIQSLGVRATLRESVRRDCMLGRCPSSL